MKLNNIIHNLIIYFNFKDEISGEWFTEDGSGFSMIMGSWVEFKSNGSGKYESWSNSKDDTGYNFSGDFTWKRIGKKQIEITEQNTSEKQILNYKLEKVNDRIELSNSEKRKVGSVEIEEFWNFSQIMFRK